MASDAGCSDDMASSSGSPLRPSLVPPAATALLGGYLSESNQQLCESSFQQQQDDEGTAAAVAATAIDRVMETLSLANSSSGHIYFTSNPDNSIGSSASGSNPVAAMTYATSTSPTAVKLLLTNAASGIVIGRGGSHRDFIQRISGARMQLSKPGEFFSGTTERTLLLSGSFRSILVAAQCIISRLVAQPAAIAALLAEGPQHEGHAPPGDAETPGAAHPQAVERELSNAAAGTARLMGDAAFETRLTEGFVTGGTAAEAGSNSIGACDNTADGSAAAAAVATLGGPCSSTPPSRRSSADVALPPRPVAVAAAATSAVPVTMQPTFMVRAVIPAGAVGSIIGKGGSMVKQISQVSGVNISISSQDRSQGLIEQHRILTITSLPAVAPTPPTAASAPDFTGLPNDGGGGSSHASHLPQMPGAAFDNAALSPGRLSAAAGAGAPAPPCLPAEAQRIALTLEMLARGTPPDSPYHTASEALPASGSILPGRSSAPAALQQVAAGTPQHFLSTDSDQGAWADMLQAPAAGDDDAAGDGRASSSGDSSGGGGRAGGAHSLVDSLILSLAMVLQRAIGSPFYHTPALLTVSKQATAAAMAGPIRTSSGPLPPRPHQQHQPKTPQGGPGGAEHSALIGLLDEPRTLTGRAGKLGKPLQVTWAAPGGSMQPLLQHPQMALAGHGTRSFSGPLPREAYLPISLLAGGPTSWNGLDRTRIARSASASATLWHGPSPTEPAIASEADMMLRAYPAKVAHGARPSVPRFESFQIMPPAARPGAPGSRHDAGTGSGVGFPTQAAISAASAQYGSQQQQLLRQQQQGGQQQQQQAHGPGLGCTVSLLVPRVMIPFITGQQGETVSSIQQLLGVTVSIERLPTPLLGALNSNGLAGGSVQAVASAAAADVQVTLTGQDTSSVQMAEAIIRQKVASSGLAAPQNKHSSPSSLQHQQQLPKWQWQQQQQLPLQRVPWQQQQQMQQQQQQQQQYWQDWRPEQGQVAWQQASWQQKPWQWQQQQPQQQGVSGGYQQPAHAELGMHFLGGASASSPFGHGHAHKVDKPSPKR